MTHWTFACWALSVALAGCSNSMDDQQQRAAKQDGVWGTQIEEAKAGKRTTLSVPNKTVRDADLARLADVPQIEKVVFDFVQITDSGFAHLAKLTKLKSIRILDPDLSHCPVGDAGLTAIAGLPELEELAVPSARATDAAAAAVGKLPKLRFLNLHQTQLTDTGVAEIAKNEKLELLRLGSPKITDAALGHIAKIKELRELILLDSPVTDASVMELANCEHLDSLQIMGTQITEEGLSKLATLRPKLHLHFNDKHVGGDHGHD